MKVGIISDIHGNHYALKEVLKDAEKKGIERVLVLGDLVGYYYRPDLVLELLSEWKYDIIKGNHEDLLEKRYKNIIAADILKGKYGSGHEQALKRLDNITLQWLFKLPKHRIIVIDGITFQLNHGSPRSIDEYLYPDSPLQQLESCSSEICDFVLIGHSHYAFTYQCKKSVLINCGSVGQSRQKGGVAYWASVDTITKDYTINETPYDTSSLLSDLRSNDPEMIYSYNILLR